MPAAGYAFAISESAFAISESAFAISDTTISIVDTTITVFYTTFAISDWTLDKCPMPYAPCPKRRYHQILWHLPA
jgi:hypothetical protein